MPTEAQGSSSQALGRGRPRGRGRTVTHPTQQRPRRRASDPRPPRDDIIFPVEIWKLVFEYLHPHYNQQELAQLVRFLPALRREAERLLYTQPRIVGSKSAVNFSESVAAELYRAHAVQDLSLVMTEDDRPECLHTKTFFNAIVNVLPKLPRLRSIGLAGGDPAQGMVIPKAPPLTLPMLLDKLPDGTSLRAFRGHTLSLNARTVAFLNGYPKLEEIRLGPVYDNNVPERTLADVCLPNLRALAIWTYMAPQLEPWHYIKNLTHLRLTSMHDFDSPSIDNALDLLGPQLKSLRLDKCFRATNARTRPSARDIRWGQCARLRFVQLEDRVAGNFQPWETKDASFKYTPNCWAEEIPALPPQLETLVWAPMWTRRHNEVGPSWKNRSLLRHYAEDLLKGHASLKNVLYLWNDEGYCHCWLEDGHMMEGWANPRDVDGDAWAQVV